MKKIVSLAFFTLLITVVSAQIKVACIGNSITFGHGLKKEETYPSQLQKILGSDWSIENFGVSGRTLLANGDYPYIKEKAYANAKAFLPDVAIIKLGTNDAKPQNWKFKDEFVNDYIAMIKELEALPSKPLVLVCFPVPAYGINFNINDSIVNNEIVKLVKIVAKKGHVKIINLNKPLSNHPEWFPDKIHPTADGAGEIAKVVSRKLLKYKKKINRRKKHNA
ncbi:MAG: GDSL-type esterase/lipase family protein [Chitinophagaceae bacterium]